MSNINKQTTSLIKITNTPENVQNQDRCWTKRSWSVSSTPSGCGNTRDGYQRQEQAGEEQEGKEK